MDSQERHTRYIMKEREGILRGPLANRLEGFSFALDRLGIRVVDLICVVKGTIAVVGLVEVII